MNTFDAAITFLYTKDMDKARYLWEDLIGLGCVVDQTSCRIYRIAAGAFVGICQLQKRPTETVGVTVTLVTDEVDAICAKIEEAGFSFERRPAYMHEFDIYSALFHDSDGYRIEIQRFCSSEQVKALTNQQ